MQEHPSTVVRQLPSTAQSGLRERTLFAAVGIGAMVVGTCYYLLCRQVQPVLLAMFDIGWQRTCAPDGANGSWPSFFHALAFTALLSACGSITARRVWRCALLWCAANALWECGGASLVHWLSNGDAPALICVGDPLDILFAAVGACLPVLLVNTRTTTTTT